MIVLLMLLAFVRLALAAVDLNSADAAALESLPGIGPSKAAAIVQYRTDHGPFKSVDELDNVAGIGPSTLANIRDLVSVGATAAAPAPPEGGKPTVPPAAPGTAGCPVDINAADAGGLGKLPGIGESKAAAILQYRTDNGKFKSCDELDNVSGIGAATLAGLKDCCVAK